MHSCYICSFQFSRQDALSRHLKRKYPCDRQNRKQYDPTSRNQSEQIECETIKKEIPTFDGAEFCGKKPISHETLDKIMEMLDIPVGRREGIKRAEEKEVGESSSRESEHELEKTIGDFQRYYYELSKSKRHENITPLINILNIWKEYGQITEQKYQKVLRKVLSF